MITFIDLFSGIGGFRLGLKKSSERYRCVWSCDWDKHANRIYRYRFGEKNHYAGDIGQVDASSIPDHDVLCAGFPCQAFSFAGRRKGFEDTRGTLFFDIARIAEAKKPALLLLENVKGLLSVQKGYCFARILQTLDELGYWVEWQVLNSKYFGVPQSRERVFIIGHLRGKRTKQVFPLGEAGEKSIGTQEKVRGKRQQAIATQNLIEVGNIFSKKAADGRVYDPAGLSPSLRGFSFGWSKPKILERPLHLVQYGKMHSQKPQRYDEVAHTVRQDLSRNIKKPHYPVLLPDMRIRRLTPTECERLQGFPDGWTAWGLENGRRVKISDSRRYRLLGNAVTVNVVEFLGRLILDRCFQQGKA